MSSPETGISRGRRFSILSLLVVTAVFAALFGLLRAVGMPPVFMGAAALTFGLVGFGQWLFPRWRRAASAVAGALAMAMVVVVAQFTLRPRLGPGPVSELLCLLPHGALFGYLAGLFIAGAFLVRDLVLRLSGFVISLIERDATTRSN